MELSALIIPAIAAGIGWTARHFGILAPASSGRVIPVAQPATPSPVNATISGELAALLRAIVRAELANFVNQLQPVPAAPSPLPDSAGKGS